ncbi:hypothetical protein GCM10027161_50940 [Microbispora hainanensis]
MSLLPLTLSVLPDSWFTTSYMLVSPPVCPGSDLEIAVYSRLSHVLGWNFVLVPLAFAVWLLTRAGRAARVTGRAVAAYVLLQALFGPALMAYDLLTVGAGCRQVWGPSAAWNLGMAAYQTVYGVLILRAVRPAGSRPRVRLRRTAGILGVCCLLLAVPVADRGADGRYTGLDVTPSVYAGAAGTGAPDETEWLVTSIVADHSADDESVLLEEDDCDTWTVLHQSYGDTPPRDRERAFLCTARDVAGYAPRLVTLPDRELLAFGRALCGVADRPSTEPRVRTLLDQAGAYDWSWSLMNALVFLCPDTVARKRPELVLSEAEAQKKEDDHQAEMTAHCADPARRPRAVRRATTALFVGEGGGYLVEGDTYGTGAGRPRRLDRAFDAVIDRLTTTSVSVRTAVENSSICVSVKALNRAPRVRLRGWDTVAETGVVSMGGRIELLGEGDAPLPNLAVAGPGRYRVRVYVRGQEEALRYASERPVEEHLVLVFPGTSGKTLFLRG